MLHGMDTAHLDRFAADAMRSRGLLPEFSAQVMREAQAQRRSAPDATGDIRDLRRLTWFSIDNDDTQDLDQLTVAEPLAGGAARLLVAIADVDARVPAGSAIDGHAATNTTSVYTAARVFPMLPEILSTDLTSLHEERERLAVVVEMEIAPDGTVVGTQLYRACVVNRAKDLIADVMIAANSATARFLAERGFPSIRRFLQSPRRWERIVALAASHGAELPAAPDAPALDRFLGERRAADPRGFADLSLAVVKLLGSGEYTAQPPDDQPQGHFGLAVNDYAHSTAPNRRFPDLVTQRLLKAAVAGDAPPYSLEALGDIARHCTLQEDNANRVERQVLKAAAAFLLHGRIGEVFDAIVTGTPAKGTFARIAHPMVEGRVVRGHQGLDVGDAVRLRLVAVDAAQGFIDFERA